jgi:hypothetical protein
MLYYCTLISPRFDNSRIFAEVCKVMHKRMYGKIIGRALLQCDLCTITILRANLKKRCANIQAAQFVEIQTLLLLDAFYEFSRCDTCNFLEIPDRCSALIVSYTSKQLRSRDEEL